MKTMAKAIVVGWVLVAVLLVGPSILLEKATCGTLADMNPTVQYSWVLYGGCLMQMPDGIWAHYSHYYYYAGEPR